MKQYKKYSDVPKKYKFDLDYLLQNEKIEDLIKQLSKLFENEIKIKDSKYSDAKTYLNYLKSQEKSVILMNRIMNYITNNISTNVVSPEFNKLYEDLSYKIYNFQKELGSETNRIFKNEKKIKEWIELKEFKNFKKDLEFTLSKKKYKFDDKIEEFIKRISRAEVNADEIFSIITNSEMNYKFAKTSKGKEIKITPANRTKLMMHPDESVRKTTYLNWIGAYLKHKNSLSSILYQHFKQLSTWALERKYKSTVESLIFDDRVDTKLLETVYKNVKKYNYLFLEFNKIHAKFYKAKFNKKMKKWDYLVPLIKTKEDYSIEESQKLVKNSLEPMGKEYLSVITKMFNENWVDYCIVDNKRSGAYSIGSTYGLEKKFILMNHDGKLRSVSTLAHEAGHSLHSYFSDENQPFNLSQYPIFLAEIASIFNELMLLDYLFKNTKDEKLRFYLLSTSIDDFEATVRRQTMWSEYEYNLYNKIDQGESFATFDSIKTLYKNVIRNYVDPKNKLDKDEDLYGSIMVPHYYYHFYVYKYAVGYLVANYFFQRYKKEGKKAIEIYINEFLKKGCSQWPVELLKNAGVDLYDDNFYQEAFKELENKINQYRKLGKKIFKC